MKTLVYLIITSFISTGAIMAGFFQGSIVLGYGIGIISWALFLRHLFGRGNNRK